MCRLFLFYGFFYFFFFFGLFRLLGRGGGGAAALSAVQQASKKLAGRRRPVGGRVTNVENSSTVWMELLAGRRLLEGEGGCIGQLAKPL